MKYEGIFFDLDGTLLPMDNDCFTRGYFHHLAEAVAPLGYREESLVRAMWMGVASMIKGDGSRANSAAFWETFSSLQGNACYEHIPYFDHFYKTDFHECIRYTSPNPEMARQAVDLANQKAKKVVLATNPMFPRVAVEARLAWAGLSPHPFCHITDYDNSGTCKPNPAYYLEIARKLALDPTRCLMIGNNAQEDIEAAQTAGLSTFLLTDCLIAKGEIPQTPKGNFRDLIDFLSDLETYE